MLKRKLINSISAIVAAIFLSSLPAFGQGQPTPPQPPKSKATAKRKPAKRQPTARPQPVRPQPAQSQAQPQSPQAARQVSNRLGSPMAIALAVDNHHFLHHPVV